VFGPVAGGAYLRNSLTFLAGRTPVPGFFLEKLRVFDEFGRSSTHRNYALHQND
jgi:hypothetical protein